MPWSLANVSIFVFNCPAQNYHSRTTLLPKHQYDAEWSSISQTRGKQSAWRKCYRVLHADSAQNRTRFAESRCEHGAWTWRREMVRANRQWSLWSVEMYNGTWIINLAPWMNFLKQVFVNTTKTLDEDNWRQIFSEIIVDYIIHKVQDRQNN